jgi:hypothetical protein
MLAGGTVGRTFLRSEAVRTKMRNMKDLCRKTGRGAPVKPAMARAWVMAWKTASMEMEGLRRQKLRRLTPRQVQQAMVGFDGAFKAVLWRKAGRKTSGLVELQAWFRRMRK